MSANHTSVTTISRELDVQKKSFVEPVLHMEASLADATLVSGGSYGPQGGSNISNISSISNISRD